MDVFDRFPLDMLRKMRASVASLVPDADGNVSQVIGGQTLTVSFGPTLAMFDAAIARRPVYSEPTQ